MKTLVNFRSLPYEIRDYHIHHLAISHDIIQIENYIKSTHDVDKLSRLSAKLIEIINFINCSENETENTENSKDCLGDN